MRVCSISDTSTRPKQSAALRLIALRVVRMSRRLEAKNMRPCNMRRSVQRLALLAPAMQRAARTAAAAAMNQVVYVTAETHGWQEYDGAMESNPQGITRVMQAPIRRHAACIVHLATDTMQARKVCTVR